MKYKSSSKKPNLGLVCMSPSPTGQIRKGTIPVYKRLQRLLRLQREDQWLQLRRTCAKSNFLGAPGYITSLGRQHSNLALITFLSAPQKLAEFSHWAGDFPRTEIGRSSLNLFHISFLWVMSGDQTHRFSQPPSKARPLSNPQHLFTHSTITPTYLYVIS